MKEIILPNGKMRRYRSQEEIASLVAQFQSSGRTMHAFCLEHQLSPNVLQRWLRKNAPAAPSATDPTAPMFQEVPVSSLHSGWVAEAALPSGIVLRFATSVPGHLIQALCAAALR